MAQRRILLDLPNQLSLLRIGLTFVLVWLVLQPGTWPKVAALAGFGAASLTDWLDGWIARRWRVMSPFGALIDPIADKVLVLGVFLAFIQRGLAPAWMVLVILIRELAVTMARLYVARRRVVLSAAREGKQKMVSQIVAIIVILLVDLIRATADPQRLALGWNEALQRLVLLCLWVAVILTVVSGAAFFIRHGKVLWRTATGLR